MNHADKLAAALQRVYDDVSDLSPETYGAVGEALAAHEAYTFADACSELADRARVVLDNNPGLCHGQQRTLEALGRYAYAVGHSAGCTPDLYLEPRA